MSGNTEPYKQQLLPAPVVCIKLSLAESSPQHGEFVPVPEDSHVPPIVVHAVDE